MIHMISNSPRCVTWALPRFQSKEEGMANTNDSL